MKYTVTLAQPAVWQGDIGVVQKWHKQLGEAVSIGETLVTVALPSGDGEVPIVSPTYGILATRVVLPGETVEVGEPVAILAGVPCALVTGAEQLPSAPVRVSLPSLPETTCKLPSREADIARALARAARDAAPQLTVAQADVTEAVRLGAKMQLPLLPFVIHTAAVSLVNYPVLNSCWVDESDGGASIRQLTPINIGLVRHDADGIAVAVVAEAHRKSLRALAEDCAPGRKDGTLREPQQQAATFLLSETPPGVTFQTGLLHSPLAAHLSFGTVDSPARLTLCLHTDARVVAPSVAAAFLSDLCRGLAEARFLFAG